MAPDMPPSANSVSATTTGYAAKMAEIVTLLTCQARAYHA
jgi:hypothetical protein